ncbi:MAG: hypothetical protein ACPHK8_05080 [Thermoplasmatota archaeon]
MSEWAERKSLRLAGHVTVGVLALLLILWVVNVFALGNPIAKGASVGHDTAWLIIAIVLAILLIVLEVAILWPQSEPAEQEWEDAAPVDTWSEGADDGWSEAADDGWTDDEWVDEEPVYGTVEHVQEHARTGDKMLGCPDCGTVFLKRAHEIDEAHELDFNCPNCGADGHYEPGQTPLSAQIHEHTCTRCSYVYEAYQDAHQCPSCHAEQH